MNRPKLKTLKPRLSAAPMSRLQMAPTRPGVERKRGSAGVKDRNRIRARDYGLCVLCEAEGKVSLGRVVDHPIPLWAGGSDEDNNKQLLCDECHDAKTAREAAQRAAGGYTG